MTTTNPSELPPDDSRAVSRGAKAITPWQLPLRGWWAAIRRTKDSIGEDQVSLLSAGVAFYGLLSLAPALAALISLFGLFASPSLVERGLEQVQFLLPASVLDLVAGQLHELTQQANSKLSLSFVASLFMALWSASKGTQGLMGACTVAYSEKESRPYLVFVATGIALATGGLLVGLGVTLFVVGVPILLGQAGLSSAGEWATWLLRYPILVCVLLLSLSVIYRWGPSREVPRWEWVSPGSILGTVLLLVGSVSFSAFVASFGTYNETYGSLGAVVVMLLWLWLSAYSVILGAELNAELERQTAQDSTHDPEEPRGERGAVVADQAVALSPDTAS